MSIRHPVRIGFGARKGGEGKTFGAANVAGELASKGYKVLVVVCDQQDDLSRMYLLDQEDGKRIYDHDTAVSLSDVLSGNANVRDAIYTTREYPLYEWDYNEDGSPVIDPNNGRRKRTFKRGETVNFDIVPAGMDIYNIDVFFKEDENGELVPYYDIFDDKFAEVLPEYDFVIFDIPPSDQDISMIAYASSDYLLTPYDMSGTDSMPSVQMMVTTVDELNSIPEITHPIAFMIYMNRFRPKRPMDMSNMEIIMDEFDGNVFKTPIRESMEAKYAKADGCPLSCYKKCDVGEDVAYVVDELLERVKEDK